MDTLARARTSFEQRVWADSCRLFAAADRDAPLEPEDLERHAIAAYLTGRDDESEALWARAHQRSSTAAIPKARRERPGGLGLD